MKSWMLGAPRAQWTGTTAKAFQMALDAKNPGLLPEGLPR